jgi:hypothetical protein
MEMLDTAVVDLTTLVATCQALARDADQGPLADPHKLRRRLRREIKRGTLAYIDTLARAKRGGVDAHLLEACRAAAEGPMALAIAHQAPLREMMLAEAGALAGLAAERQDLWRLAHLANYLRQGSAALRAPGISVDAKALSRVTGRLRRRLRRALVAYARAALRKRPQPAPLAGARRAALAEIGRSGATLAERLADLEAQAAPELSLLRLGVAKPLLDLALDWKAHEPPPA